MIKIIFWAFTVMVTTACSAQHKNQTMKNTLSPYHFSSKTVHLSDGELSYMKEGKGQQTLIFLHGLSSNGDAWSKNIEDLKENYTCIALDLPGYGRSYKVATEFTPTYFSKVLKEFVDAQKIRNFVLVGHSMGGQAAMKFTHLYPDYVSKLVLIAPAGIEEFTTAEAETLKNFTTQKHVMATTDEQIKKNYEFNFYQMPNDVDKMINDRIAIRQTEDFADHALAIEKSVKGMLDDKVIDDIKTIEKPTLLVFGEEDRLIPNRFLHPTLSIQNVAESASKLFKKSEVKMLPNSGHFVQFEKPKEVNEYIIEFIK